MNFSRKNFVLVYIGWWVFWILVQALVLHRLDLGWGLAFTDALVSNLLLALLTFGSMLLYRFYQPGTQNRLLRLFFALVVTWLYTVCLSFSLHFILPEQQEYLAMADKTMPLRFVCGFLFMTFFTILNWLWNSLKEQNELLRRHNETEKLAREAELVKLRQQLQPHFLFNSLNSISALAASDPDEARKMIQQLSDFLRGTLRKDEEKTIPLEEELKQLELYLSIEKVRFGDRLEVKVHSAEGISGAGIPPLILQPLVENAIKYGLYGTMGDVSIKVDAALVNGMLQVTTSNPYDADSSYRSNGTGFGLSFIERRLFLLYGRKDLLSTSAADGIFTAVLKIPQ